MSLLKGILLKKNLITISNIIWIESFLNSFFPNTKFPAAHILLASCDSQMIFVFSMEFYHVLSFLSYSGQKTKILSVLVSFFPFLFTSQYLKLYNGSKYGCKTNTSPIESSSTYLHRLSSDSLLFYFLFFIFLVFFFARNIEIMISVWISFEDPCYCYRNSKRFSLE